MNAKPVGKALRKPVGSWLPHADYLRFEAVVKRSGSTFSAYLRSMIVDVIAEEEDRHALQTGSLSVSPTASCQPAIIQVIDANRNTDIARR